MTDSVSGTASQHSDNDNSPSVDIWATLENLIGTKSLWLANTECFTNRDIIAESLPSSGWGPGSGKALYEKVLVDDGTGRKRVVKRLFVAGLTGQLGTSADGTRLGAAGDTWGKTIENKTKVKMALALKGFDGDLEGEFARNITLDQRVGIDEICARFFKGGMSEYMEHKADQTITFRPILKIANNGGSWLSDIGGRFSNEVIKLSSKDLYHIDTSGIAVLETPHSAAIPLARSNRKRKADASDEQPEPATSSAAQSLPEQAPIRPEVTLESKYHPSILPGHDDPQIRHTGTVQVNQFDWRREDNTLITPGDYYRVLRPGTKVIIGASFRFWDVKTKDGRSMTFQAIAETLKVFERAPGGHDDDDDDLLASVKPPSLSEAVDDTASVPDAIADSFHSFNFAPSSASTSSTSARNPVTPSVTKLTSTSSSTNSAAVSGDIEMADTPQASTSSPNPKKPKKNKNKNW